MKSAEITKEQLAKMIDHSVVDQGSTEEEVKLRCAEAKKYGFASLYVCPCYITLAKKLLEGSGIPVGTPIAYPQGATTTEVKVFEAKQAIELGADILDIVINVGMLKANKLDYVKEDLRAVIDAAKEKKRDIVTKVIIETGKLTRDEIVAVSKIVKEVGADFVKTSTGYLAAGPKEEDIKLIREAVGNDFGIKASGDIKTPEKAIKMIEAGANLIGEDAGVGLVEGLDFVRSLIVTKS